MVWGNWDIAVGNWNNNLGQGKSYRTKTFIFATIMFTCDWLTLLLELRPELLISLQAYPVTCPHPVVDVHYSLSVLYCTVLYNNDEAKHYNPGLRPLHPPSTSMFLLNYLQKSFVNIMLLLGTPDLILSYHQHKWYFLPP